MLASLGVSRSGDDVVHVLNLSLSTAESTELLLGELSSSLITGVSQQLNDSSLVRSLAGNLLDEISDKSGSLREGTLSSRDSSGGGSGSDLVALVGSNSDS